jgi:hypothetical protein
MVQSMPVGAKRQKITGSVVAAAGNLNNMVEVNYQNCSADWDSASIACLD